jgi:hypothetical protein
LGARLTVLLTPLPVRATDCGLSLALSLMVTAALMSPVDVGLKVRLIVQLAPALSEVPQVVVSAN